MKYPLNSLTLVLLLASLTAAANAAEITTATRQVNFLHKEGQASQRKIDHLKQQALSASDEYLDNERQADLLQAYNNQLRKQLTSQTAEINALEQQLLSLADTRHAVIPMLSNMISNLEAFVAQDLPFLPHERAQRIEKLNALLERADLSLAEKYRQILEAYMVEIDYGRTLEAYPGTLNAAGNTREVTFLRLGRTALYYQTLNGLQSGLWQPEQQRWEELSKAQSLTLQKAIQVARQQAVPTLLSLPLPPLPSTQ